ncbi:MAG: hypothetical protein WCS31_03470 [Verrucomicrobiae bacterium]
MNDLISDEVKSVLKNLAENQRQIVGWVEPVSVKALSPDDVLGLGLAWSHYVSELKLATGLTVYSAINADADYSFTVALGNKSCELTPYKERGPMSEALWSLRGRKSSAKRRRANLALRLSQIGIVDPFDQGVEVDPVKFQCPCNFMWTQLLMRLVYPNGLTALAGIDRTAHHVCVYLQADEGVELDPLLVRHPALRKAHF